MKCVAVAVFLCVTASALCGSSDDVHGRKKRTIGVIFRGLVDAAANQAAARYEHQRQLTSTTAAPVTFTTPVPTLSPIDRIRQPPRPMIYIIPVSNRSPHHNEISDLAEVLRHIKAPMKIKNENGTVDPDLKQLIQATRHLTIDKRNASYKPTNNDKENIEENENLVDKTEITEKIPKKQFSIKIQPPKEVNSQKQFTIKIEGDDVRVKKTKDGYNVRFTLPDTSANIRIEYPQQMFEKQELKPQQNYNNNYNLPPFYGPGPAGGGFPYQGGYPGFGAYNPYQNPYGPGFTPTTAQQFPGQYPAPNQPDKDVEQVNSQHPNRFTPTAAQQPSPPYAYPGGHPFSQYPGFDPYRSPYAPGFTDPYSNNAGHGQTPSNYQDPYQQLQYGGPGGFSDGGYAQPYPGGPQYNSRQGSSHPQLDQGGSENVPCVIDPESATASSNSNCTSHQ